MDEHVIGHLRQTSGLRCRAVAEQWNKSGWKHGTPHSSGSVRRRADGFRAALREESRGSGLEVRELERLFQEDGISAERPDLCGNLRVAECRHDDDGRA